MANRHYFLFLRQASTAAGKGVRLKWIYTLIIRNYRGYALICKDLQDSS